MALRLQQVGAVDATGGDRDQNFARARLRLRHVLQQQAVIGARIFDGDGFHDSLLREGKAARKLRFPNLMRKGAAMDSDELLPRKKAPDIVLGEELGALSAHELEERIVRLEAEIARTRQAIATRLATRSAAENFFKR